MTTTDPTPQTPGALDGIRVLDFTQMMLGPFATQVLADLGADVIKVERPQLGEWERGLEFAGRLIGTDSAAFVAMNRNKRSVALDLKGKGARDALLRLAATCDVVVENFRPGVMERLGLGYDDFRAVRPDIIYCSGSGWGQRTKYALENRPGQDLLIQAASGLALNTGAAGDPPIAAGTSICDATGALTLANGILAALLARYRHGVGQRVEVDLFHATMAILTQEISAMVNLGLDFTRSEAGIAQPWLSAPFGIYRTADGWIAIAMGSLSAVADVFDAPDVAIHGPLDRPRRRQAAPGRADAGAAHRRVAAAPARRGAVGRAGADDEGGRRGARRRRLSAHRRGRAHLGPAAPAGRLPHHAVRDAVASAAAATGRRRAHP